MALQLILFVLAVSVAQQGNGFFLGRGLSKELDECMPMITPDANNVTRLSVVALNDINVQSSCLQEYVWKFGGVNWADFNISSDEVNVINGLSTDLVTEQHRRLKRSIGGPGPGGPGPHLPRNGYSIRREYRTLSDQERHYFHKACNIMKKKGIYDIFAKIHKGIVVLAAHGGPGFFAWHRIYIALFEQALRNVNPRLSLPYWDTTLDFAMKNPYYSIIFSPPFMGNGNGYVTTGPFANWPTHIGSNLLRNIGGGSRLISKQDVMRLLTKCHIGKITYPHAKPAFNAEVIHGGPHIWVGGHMSGLNTAGADPLFFLYHCFIDYIYELFRENQRVNCGVNPDTDYPVTVPSHHPNLPAAGLPPYRMIDGASSFWTRYWFRYAPSPTCNKYSSCGSPYLVCIGGGQCASAARPFDGGFGAGGPGSAGYGAAFAQVSQVDFGPTFDAPESDGRSAA